MKWINSVLHPFFAILFEIQLVPGFQLHPELQLLSEKRSLGPLWNQQFEFQKCQFDDTLELCIKDWNNANDEKTEMYKIQQIKLTKKYLEMDQDELYREIPVLSCDSEEEKSEIMIRMQYEKTKESFKEKSLRTFGYSSKVETTKLDIDMKPPYCRPLKLVYALCNYCICICIMSIYLALCFVRLALTCSVYCFQARNLDNLDVRSESDPYMVARFCGEEAKTKVIQDNNHPEWYQALVLDVDVPHPTDPTPNKCRPKIYCEIFDEDNVKKDELLGRFAVPPPMVDRPLPLEEFVENLEPKWYSLTDAEGCTVNGEVLAAFQLLEHHQFDFSPPPDLNVFRKAEKTRLINIITIGLRDIQSVFVNKPFIEFECRGEMERTEPSNIPSSRNPNFHGKDAKGFEIADPKQPVFLPNLKLTVKDSVCKVLRKLPEQCLSSASRLVIQVFATYSFL